MLIRRRNKLGKLGIQFLQTRYHDLYSARFDWLNAHILKKKKKRRREFKYFRNLALYHTHHQNECADFFFFFHFSLY